MTGIVLVFTDPVDGRIDIKDFKTYLGAWFWAPNRFRLSYALDIQQIEEGLDRIRQAMKQVSVL